MTSSNAPVTKSVLSNVRVAAFTHFAAGPIAAQYLGALGADVVKVESHQRDLNRYSVRDPDDALNGVSPYFVCTNRNQRAIVVDLKSPRGLEIARKLIASCNVVLENYRPGVLDRLGLGYEHAKQIKADIIYCSFSAFDPTGPARDRPGQDLLLQAASGLASLSGRADSPPVPVSAYVIDGFTAMQGVVGIVAAILHHRQTGEGQLVRADMMSTALYMMMQEASFVQNAGTMTTRPNSPVGHLNQGAPYGIYQTRNGAIAISVFGGPAVIRELAKALGLEEELSAHLEERKLKTDRDIVANAFQRVLRTLSIEDATGRLTRAGAWVSPVRTLAEALEDPAVRHTGIVREFATPLIKRHRVVTEPLQLSATPLRRDRAVPAHGEHTVEVLRELGYSRSDLLELLEARVVATAGQAACISEARGD